LIGNDVWIGNSATFLPSICVRDGAIIGANSVVTKDVALYAIVAGNPAREIRKRFDEETIHFLLELKWWDWEVEKIVEYLEDIVQENLCNLQKLTS
jgi:virginiamycin A acetyltransferase